MLNTFCMGDKPALKAPLGAEIRCFARFSNFRRDKLDNFTPFAKFPSYRWIYFSGDHLGFFTWREFVLVTHLASFALVLSGHSRLYWPSRVGLSVNPEPDWRFVPAPVGAKKPDGQTDGLAERVAIAFTVSRRTDSGGLATIEKWSLGQHIWGIIRITKL